MDRIKYETFSVSSWLRVSDTLSRNLLSSSLLVCSSANKLSYHTNSTIITRSCNQTDVLNSTLAVVCDLYPLVVLGWLKLAVSLSGAVELCEQFLDVLGQSLSLRVQCLCQHFLSLTTWSQLWSQLLCFCLQTHLKDTPFSTLHMTQNS